MSECGIFYGTFIDPLVNSMRKRVASEIKPNSTVIDVACGTGAQVFEMAKNTKRVVGIDLSESMISFALKKQSQLSFNHIEFVIGDATHLSQFNENEFDIATLSLALHQFPPEIYASILSELKRVAKKTIIIDYAVPLPVNFIGLLCHFIEFLAGKTHNKNFKSYYKKGGLNEILKLNNLIIQKSVLFAKGAFQLVICRPV